MSPGSRFVAALIATLASRPRFVAALIATLASRPRFVAALIATLVSIPAVAQTPTSPSDPPIASIAVQAPSPVVFENVTVIPMDTERRLTGVTVVVENARITGIGAPGSVRIPAGAVRVDGTGRFLMPGLTETHGHLPPGNQTPEAVNRVLELYVLNGVTTVRGMLGHPTQLTWRDEAARWERLSPRLVVAGPSFNGNTATSPEVARRMVEEQAAAGYDLLKIHPGVTRDAYDEMDRTADRLGIPFAGHVPLAVGVEHAIATGYRSIDHLDGFVEGLIADGAPVTSAQTGFFGLGLVEYLDLEKLAPLAAMARDAGIFVNATETLMQTMAGDGQPEAMLADPSMAWWPENQVSAWANQVRGLQNDPANTPARRAAYLALRFRLIRTLHKAGVTLILGSDAPQIGNVPGFSALRELELMAEAGLSNFEALATGTRNVGRYLGEPDFGTVAVGSRADLLLLDADPLVNVSNVRRQVGIMANGRWLSGDEIDRRLTALRLR